MLMTHNFNTQAAYKHASALRQINKELLDKKEFHVCSKQGA